MTEKFLLDAMADVREDYILDAGQETHVQKRKLPWKAILVAALIPLLTVTAFAADALNIRSLVTGQTHYSSSDFGKMDRVMEIAGFQMDVKAEFDNGFAFEQVTVQDTQGQDEDGREVLKYREISVVYRDPEGNRLNLSAHPKLEEVPASDRPADETWQMDDVTAEYRQDHYKFVPEDYQLTPQDEAWAKQTGNHISYGSERVEEKAVSFLSWEKDGVCYLLMDMGGTAAPGDLYAMAAELIEE